MSNITTAVIGAAALIGLLAPVRPSNADPPSLVANKCSSETIRHEGRIAVGTGCILNPIDLFPRISIVDAIPPDKSRKLDLGPISLPSRTPRKFHPPSTGHGRFGSEIPPGGGINTTYVW